MPNGEGFGFGDVVDSIQGALADFASAVLSTLIAVLNFLFQLVAFIFQVLVAVAQFLGNGFGKVRDFFRWAVHLNFKGFLGKLWDGFQRLKDFLHRIFDPIIKTIKAIIAYEDRLFNRYLRPLINLIQHMRQFLTLLRLLHLKFAARLDARLARVENQLASLGLQVLRELNTLRNYISLLVDPFGLFNPLTFLVTAERDIAGIRNAVKAIGERPLFASEIDRRDKDRTVFSKRGLSKQDERNYFDELANRFDVELAKVVGHTPRE